ncbi:MAG TPA: hypothetical protein VF559_01215 [Caulobacteraceae bacterium]|jgi:hypothetical protein
MQPISDPRAIIDYCLAPLNLAPSDEAGREVRRRLNHAIDSYRKLASRPVAVDFSNMPSQVINEAAHGNE